MDMNSLKELHKALNGARANRLTLAQAVAEVLLHVDADGADLLYCQDHVAERLKHRAAGVASCRSDKVVRADEQILRGNIAVEIAAGKLAQSITTHAAAVAAHATADEAVRQAADAIRVAERADIAARFVAAMDTALALGERLEFFTGPVFALPPDIVEALARVPKPDPMHTPLNQLRYGGAPSQLKWERRLVELMADEVVRTDTAQAA